MKTITIPDKGKPFLNYATHCVGTGRLGLALQKEYADHLALVQDSIKFQYVRGHGLLCNDVGIYNEIGNHFNPGAPKRIVFNVTYIDRIFDQYLAHGIKPYVELGFMPEDLKSGEETIFYWKGNTTPPNSIEKWTGILTALFTHFIERYGRDEVVSWPVEVWNEPNIGFWAGTMEQYFDLYAASAKALKAIDSTIQVGGPSICGVETEKWLTNFFAFVCDNDIPCDFITRHCYTAEMPTYEGQFIYHAFNEPTYMIDELKETREIMARYPRIKDMPLHITEFNSSYCPMCPVHDTAFQAPYIARILSEAGDYAQSYSYWTFSDVFEENGIPTSVFHGGFGLIANGSIKKPAFYAFEFFANAGKELLYRDDHIIVTKDEGRYVIITFNWHDPRTDAVATDVDCVLALSSLGKQACLEQKIVGGTAGNALQTWSNLGKPRTPNEWQLKRLREAAQPARLDKKLQEQDGRYHVDVHVEPNQIQMIEIFPIIDHTNEYEGFKPEEFFGMQ